MGKESGKQGIKPEVLCAEYEAVYHYVLSLCHHTAEAQDITQETFLKAMKVSDRFRGESSLYTWLCAIAKHIHINRCKKAGRELVTDLLPETPGCSQVEQALLEKETSLQLHQILHRLAEPYKEVFSLRVFGQLPFSDIAGLFGKTEGWARVTYHRARKSICEALRKEERYE